MKKTIMKSLVVTFISSLLLLGMSFVYSFFGGLDSNIKVLQIIDELLTYPMVNIFGAGYSEGNYSALITALQIFIIIWGISFCIYNIVRLVKRRSYE